MVCSRVRNNKEIKETISRSIGASPSLRNKKDLIEAFIDSVGITGPVDEQWREFIERKRNQELDDIIDAEKLNPDPTRSFVADALRDDQVRAAGTAITTIFPPVPRFSAEGGHGEKKQRVLTLLADFIARYFGLS